MEQLYKIKLPEFEGPMDLLLHLIRENKVDIYDIPISLITGQYLEYIEIMKELDLEIAGEFLVMAATLIQIKSRMLLPPDEEALPEEMEDPRFELVQRLLEYQAFKDAASIKGKEDERLKIFEAPRFGRRKFVAELYLLMSTLTCWLLKASYKRPPEMRTITETLTVR
jgi:chromatin segregation and condensation protein Rec8/ScpA/Scc1 (kleisin family)